MPPEARRGSYAKGVARRAQILEAALTAYATSGPQGPSLRSIADSVGLTEAGVLHYFDSKDELLVEILRARDEADLATHDLTTVDGVLGLMEAGTKTPGLLKLLLDMVAASASPEHPARKFLADRAAFVIKLVGELSGDDDPWKGRILLASAEGLCAQWLRDPSIDLVADLRRLYETL